MTGSKWIRAASGGPDSDVTTLVDHVRAVLLEQPEARTYRFLADGEGEPVSISNAELDLRARALATDLRSRFARGERALIVCPPGLDYITAFYACLYAGLIAVPVYPPNPALLKRTLPRLVAVIEDARPAVVLAPQFVVAMAGSLAEIAPALGELRWTAIDGIDPAAAEQWRRPDIAGRDIAFLQYTSGSTGTPKGVMVSHRNLMHNLDAIHRLFVRDDRPEVSHLVAWLPPYHDMGLIGCLLEPAYGGLPVTFMPPLAFLKRPVRWLRAISDQRAPYTGGPNFAYDLCVAKTTEQDRAGLDLSSLVLAFTGAEPVRAETVDRFCEAFEPYGFRRQAFYPCYGLAEGTLLVSGGLRSPVPVTRRLEAAALAQNVAADAGAGEEARTSVGCGTTIPGQQLLVVEPEAGDPLPDGQVGEIWVAGPSVAQGYWQRPEESEQVFGARLADGTGPFLRTGDLGFLDGGELHVTGRRKDMIIVAGRNHYPQDIERTVESVDPVLRPGCGVACAIEDGGEERLLLVHELDTARGLDTDRLMAGIRAAVAAEHDLQVHRIVLVRRGAVPKTSSGKVQRSACRAEVISGTLEEVAGWRLPALAAAPAAAAAPPVVLPVQGGDRVPSGGAGLSNGPAQDPQAPAGAAARRARIERWLAEEVAARVGAAPDTLDPTSPLVAYGLGSVDMVGIAGDLERRLGRTLPATLAWEYPTIEALAGFLAGDPAPGAGTDHRTRAGTQVGAEVGTEVGPEVGPQVGTEVGPGISTEARAAAGDGGPTAAEPVAIVGIGCRLPGGADSPAAFWRLLCEGRDAVTEVPADRWDAEEFLDEDPAVPGRTTTRWGGFVDGIGGFDPQFFGISPHEAARMDPQQRLLAEVAWEALEDAGVPADRLAGSATGVFVGISTNDYGRQFSDLTRIDAYTGTGNALSIAANRLSYLFDLRGPSMAIDTACSSSLVAVHQACRSLARGECSTALAGGVNVILSPALAINFSKAGAMAPDGRCKAFDARADGYVRAEGAGMVVLKPLSRAIADGDRVYGVVRGAAVNQDGRTNGLMAPNPHAQEAVLRAAYADAGLRPEQADYVEAHGTGTLLGDPIEARALAAVVGAGRDGGRPCLLGSVKSNLGHLEAAAGIAGLIKAALMLRHRTVPPSLHFEQPNPHIPFGELALEVADSLRPWPSGGGPAVAGVSSFGFGGTNAHVVLQEAPPVAPDTEHAGAAVQLLPISARSPQALHDLAARWDSRLEGAGDAAVAELCRAAALRRTHHDFRLACVGGTAEELRDALRAFAAGGERAGLSTGGRRVGRRPAVAFVFPGQGPRWWPLGADLLAAEPVFRGTLERCDALLRQHVEWSLLEQVRSGPDAPLLADPAVAQPALVAVQVALAALWRSWGVEPAAVVGHSVGEVAAAHVAGAVELADALRIALHRGRVIRSVLGKGRMAVAGLPYERARRVLTELDLPAVSVAASNGPTSTVYSGDGAALERLRAALDADGVFCRILESVDFASHGPQMEPLRAELEQALAGLRSRPATVPMVSTVTGEPGTDLGAGYWAANLRRPVLFDQAVAALVRAGHDTFVEMSPHPMLGEAIAERMAAEQVSGAVVGSLRRDEPARPAVLGELGRLYTAGFGVDWGRLHGGTAAMAELPAYPWQRQRCWLDDEPDARRRPARAGHPALQTFLRSAVQPRAYHWSAPVDLDGFRYLGDHQVDGATVLPASFLLDAALAAAGTALGEGAAVLEDVRFTRLTVVDDVAADATLQLVLVPETAGTGSFRVFGAGPPGAGGRDWEQVADGRFRAVPAGAPPPAAGTLAEVRERCGQPVPVQDHYAGLHRAGLQYGPAFQGVASLWRGDREAVARIREAAELSAERDPYLLHPAVLDSCLQVLAAAVDPAEAGTYLPAAVRRFALAAGASPRWAYALLGPAAAGVEIEDARVVLFDDAGEQVGLVDGITLRRLDAGAGDPVGDALLEPGWQQRAVDPAAAAVDPAAGWWLLLADRGGVCDGLRSALLARGGTCVTVTAGERYQRSGPTRYELDPAQPEDAAALLAELRATRSGRCAGVVHAWSLDTVLPEAGEPGEARLWQAYDRTAVSVLHLVQALAADGGEAARLVLVTRGAQRAGTEPAAPAVAQAALWGLARVVMLEHGELQPTVVDLDPGAADGSADLLDVLLLPGDDRQLAVRGGRRYVPRLQPWRPAAQDRVAWPRRPHDPDRDPNTRILAEHPGILDSLTSTAWQRTRPGPGEVQIEVSAAGLNFADVLKAMDSCPGVPPGITPLGAECAGRVTALGDGVGQLRVGDPVMAVASSSMARYATTPAYLVAPRPAGLTDEEAAAVPVAFLTAVYGLEYLARLRPGETVLIHSATGGVGLAALQVARRNGAHVLATAGTEQKRELLRSLGVQHVFDSRTLRFAEQVRAVTGGRGVDVVLNSLAGEALTRSLSLVAPNGRFVEIGKQDIYDDNHVGLGFLKHNRSFLAVDLERSFAEQPALIEMLWEVVAGGFAAGDFQALPVTCFPYSAAPAAFGLMAQARHTGKVVLRPEDDEVLAVRPGGPPVREAATYLVTGGLGALGLRTAEYLVDRGARHLVLLGRQQPSAAARDVLDRLRSRAEVTVLAADVSRAAEVDAVLARVDASMPPLAGVVHAAGILDDGLLLQQDRDRFRSVAAAKVAGGWNLHRATAGRDLDFFVLYSSAAALLGSPGQGSYAAANAFQDGLAQHRRALGLPALSIDWGPWAEAGLAARPDRGAALATRGILSLSPEQGIEALDRLLRTSAAQACVLPLDRPKLGDLAGSGLLPELLDGLLAPADRPAVAGGQGTPAVQQAMLAVEPGRRRRDLLVRHCIGEAARVLKVDESTVDTSVPLAGMGFDSLMALELRKRLEISLAVRLPATVAWRFPTIDALVPFLAERMGVALEAAPAEPDGAQPDGGELGDGDLDGGDLDRLADSEIEALLLAKMTQIDEGV